MSNDASRFTRQIAEKITQHWGFSILSKFKLDPFEALACRMAIIRERFSFP